jgi:hypothetical protein
MLAALIGIPLGMACLWILSGYIPTMNIETPAYTVLETRADYEIRRYDGFVVAETTQTSAAEGGSSGFNELFRYISGHNVAGAKIPMTAPVLKEGEEKGVKIPMAAPVFKEGRDASRTIAFVMPRGSRIDDLPMPASSAVTLREVPSHAVAAVTFSGVPSDEAITDKCAALEAALRRDNRTIDSGPIIALYNPPWTPPFMRRNEVMFRID